MKQKLLKTMLLLCALVVGSGNVWADTETFSFSTNDWALPTSSGTSARTQYTNSSTSQKVYLYAQTAYYYFSTNSCLLIGKSGSYIELPAFDKNVSQIDVTYSSGTSTNVSVNIYVGSTAVSTATKAAQSATKTYSINSSYQDAGNIYKVQITNAYNAQITSVTVHFAAASHSVTAVTSTGTNDYGTVSAASSSVSEGSTTTITAEPADGYRVSNWSVSGTGATISPAGASHSLTTTLTMGTADATVTCTFEAIPTHTITCVADPVGAGTFDAVSSLYEGATTSVKATANSGYKFKSWSVSGTGASISSTTDNPTSLTMGTGNVTLTANFDAVTTYAITYSVNGNETIVNVPEGDALDFSAPASGIPTGYYFKGWRTSTLAVTDTDPDDYVTSATSTADITYYAVMAVRTASSPDTYEKLGSNSFDSKATYVIGGVQGGSGDGSDTMWYLYSYENTDEDLGWGTCTSTPSTVEPVTFTLSGTATALVAKDNSDNYLTCISVKKFAMSSTSTTVYLHTDGSIKTASDGNLLRYNHNSGSGGLRWYASTTGTQAYFYKVVDNNTYGGYCTTIPPVSVTVGDASYATFACDFPLDFTDSDIKAYIAKASGTTGVTFTQINKVPANTGVLLYYDGGTTENIPVFAGSADATTGNVFVRGTGATVASVVETTKHNYILNNVGGVVGFYRAAGQTVAKNRAYIQIDESAGIKEFISLDLEDAPDGISLTPTLSEGEGAIYNLVGQRISKMQKGINIVNGKKILK